LIGLAFVVSSENRFSPTSADQPAKNILSKYFESGLENGMTMSMPETEKKHDVV